MAIANRQLEPEPAMKPVILSKPAFQAIERQCGKELGMGNGKAFWAAVLGAAAIASLAIGAVQLGLDLGFTRSNGGEPQIATETQLQAQPLTESVEPLQPARSPVQSNQDQLGETNVPAIAPPEAAPVRESMPDGTQAEDVAPSYPRLVRGGDYDIVLLGCRNRSAPICDVEIRNNTDRLIVVDILACCNSAGFDSLGQELLRHSTNFSGEFHTGPISRSDTDLPPRVSVRGTVSFRYVRSASPATEIAILNLEHKCCEGNWGGNYVETELRNLPVD